MFKDILTRVGLNPEEAQIYETLLEHGPQKAADLLEKTPLKRGLLYKTLHRLEDLRLVKQITKEGATMFTPESPEILDAVATEQEKVAVTAHEQLSAILPELKAKYSIATERPLLRFYEGLSGLKKIYDLMIKEGVKDIYTIRNYQTHITDTSFRNWYTNFVNKRGEFGINTHTLMTDHEGANHDPAIDEARKMMRTWIRPQDYSAPIELHSFGNKTAIISHGKEIFGILIENAPLAQAMKEIWALSQKGAETTPVSHDHPKIVQ